MLTHSLTTLSNGLPVLRIPMPGVGSVSVLALANTGSRYEQPAAFGIAHFLEHLVFKGTKNYPTPQALATTIDGIGADFNAFTSKEYTGYYVKAASRHVELALDIVSEMLLTPRLRQRDIDREKNVIIEEIHMYEDMPQRQVGNLFDRLTFAGSGLEHDIIGSAETVSALIAADFEAFLARWYGLSNLVLVVAGDAERVGSEEVLAQVETAFSKPTVGRGEKKIDVAAGLTSTPFSQQRFHLQTKQTEQAHLVLAWPGIDRYDEGRYALSLLGIILGGNMSSRLFTEVREKRGLAYYVRSEIDVFHDAGVFGVTAGVDPRRAEEAVRVIINEFEKLDGADQDLITAGELERAKEHISGKMALQLEDSLAVAQQYGLRQLLACEIEPPSAVLEKLRAVELEEIQELVRRLIKPGEMRLTMIGPFEDKSLFEKFI